MDKKTLSPECLKALEEYRQNQRKAPEDPIYGGPRGQDREDWDRAEAFERLFELELIRVFHPGF